MHKVRLTWKEYIKKEKLVALDVKVNLIDPAWPIDDYKKPKIHVNPKFIKPEKDQVCILKFVCIDWIGHSNWPCQIIKNFAFHQHDHFTRTLLQKTSNTTAPKAATALPLPPDVTTLVTKVVAGGKVEATKALEATKAGEIKVVRKLSSFFLISLSAVESSKLT